MTAKVPPGKPEKGRARVHLTPIGRLPLPRVSYKRKIIVVAVLLLILFAVQILLNDHPEYEKFYAKHIFKPWQNVRNWLFGGVPFSVGDSLYIAGGIWVLAGLIRWVYYIARLKTHRHEFAHSFLRTIITAAVFYLLFFIGWGGNYYKPALSKHWDLHTAGWDTANLIRFDKFLIAKLNEQAPVAVALPFKEVEKRAVKYYRTKTDSRTSLHGLNAKPSMFGYFMQYLQIQGYYNPFTGEAQVNKFLPHFMLPFVVCHEMAHQSGIAAEDDANLLSYALCTAVPDKSFSYSGYFNLWLYTHARLREIDTAKASVLRKTLNPISIAQVDTLRAIRKLYRSEVGSMSTQIYDGYLRMHNQKDGIDSYFKVAVSAWALEADRDRIGKIVRIP